MLLFRFLQHKTELGLILSSDILRHDFVVSFAFNNRVFLNCATVVVVGLVFYTDV